jgi:hypothetical protein
MAKKTESPEYFCVAVKRNYEDIWRMVSSFPTRDAAQADLDKRRGYTGVFNYDNAELRVISRAEAKKEFGKDWEYSAIGSNRPKPAKVKKPEGEIELD